MQDVNFVLFCCSVISIHDQVSRELTTLLAVQGVVHSSCGGALSLLVSSLVHRKDHQWEKQMFTGRMFNRKIMGKSCSMPRIFDVQWDNYDEPPKFAYLIAKQTHLK
jgi:hypothetical protein